MVFNEVGNVKEPVHPQKPIQKTLTRCTTGLEKLDEEVEEGVKREERYRERYVSRSKPEWDESVAHSSRLITAGKKVFSFLVS